MKAGHLKYLARIERATNGVNEFGTPELVWTEIARLRVGLVERTTREFLEAGAQDRESVVFRARYRADVTTADRVRFRGAAFNIREIAELDGRKGMELRCERLEGEGET